MYYLAAPGCKCVFCPRGSHRSALWHLRQNCCQSHGAAAQAHTCDWRLSWAISRIRLAIFHISQCMSPAHSTFRLPYPVCGTSPCVPAAEMWSSSHRSQIRGFIINFFIKGLPTSRNTVFTVLNCAVEPAVLKLEQTVWDYFQWRINPHLALWWLFAEAGVLWTQLKMNHDAHVHRDDGTHLEAAR